MKITWDPAKAGANKAAHVYAYREPDVIRIISAWKANKRQRMRYEKGRG
jgi:uncharacterized DUF497 family protein